ncbi:Delta(12)-fatty-acid desaturase [Chytridiales sp. JEL 0842]|nr:Delta(12)-fatty-acid desaturase [Chytridiales sp. JEL 0842]
MPVKQRTTNNSKAAAETDVKKTTKKVVKTYINSDKYAEEWERPPFTLKEVRDAIPPELFERSLVKSFAYTFLDLAMASAMFYGATKIDGLDVSSYVKWLVLWPLYWYCQGVVCTECGHQAFSNYAWVNNTVGFILHSALLVPYYSWKISHSKHHKGCGHMKKDQVFLARTRSELGLPPKREDDDESKPQISEIPILDVLNIIKMLTIGWPAYLIFNASGQLYPRWANHFNPNSPIFERPKHTRQVLASDVGILIALAGLTYASYTFGFSEVVKYYLIPYLWVNNWLVMITFLQHTDVKVPHYRDNEWDFLRGALSTVDRDYGFLNFFHHHISDSHVVHHLFSTMPHYNAIKATPYAKKFLGKFYVKDETNIYVALYRSFVHCRFVEDEGDVLFYKQ